MSSYIKTVFAVCIGICASAPLLASEPNETPIFPSIPPNQNAFQAIPDARSFDLEASDQVGTILQNQNARNAFGIACDEILTLTPRPDQTVLVSLDLPCRRSEQIKISHAGLAFDLRTDDTGSAVFEMPILDYSGVIESRLRDGSAISRSIPGDDAGGINRVAVEWFDGEMARVSFSDGSAKDRNIIRLGDGTGHVIDVVTKPQSARRFTAVDRLVIASQITEGNCLENRYGKVRRVLHNQPAVEYDLSIAAPGCSRIGTSMVLKNVLQDLILAED